MRQFGAEADMVGLIGAAAETLAGPGAIAVFEVPAGGAGVPDVVAAVLDQEVAQARAESGFLLHASGVAALLALSDANGDSLDVRQVAAGTGLSPGYLRARVLPGLAGRRLAVTSARGRWSAAGPYRSPARRLVTVEAKLRDWRRGLGQASRHAGSADAAWLVLDAARTRPAAARADWFRQAGVGLAGLSPAGPLTTLVAPQPAAGLVIRARRAQLAERVAEMHRTGTVSGPAGRVFGRDLGHRTQVITS
jgi:hypothetical protein